MRSTRAALERTKVMVLVPTFFRTVIVNLGIVSLVRIGPGIREAGTIIRSSAILQNQIKLVNIRSKGLDMMQRGLLFCGQEDIQYISPLCIQTYSYTTYNVYSSKLRNPRNENNCLGMYGGGGELKIKITGYNLKPSIIPNEF